MQFGNMWLQGPISGSIFGTLIWATSGVERLGLDSCSCYLACRSDIAIHMQLTMAEADWKAVIQQAKAMLLLLVMFPSFASSAKTKSLLKPT